MCLPEGPVLNNLSPAFLSLTAATDGSSPSHHHGFVAPSVEYPVTLLSTPTSSSCQIRTLFDTGPENLEREGLVTTDEFEVISIEGE